MTEIDPAKQVTLELSISAKRSEGRRPAGR